MGDIADMIIEGLLDYETQELIDGYAPGYPRTMKRGIGPKKKRKAFRCGHCKRTFTTQQGADDHTRDKHPESEGK